VLDTAKADGLAANKRNGPSLLSREVWRDAAIIWAIQFALVAAITYFGRILILEPSGTTPALTWQSMFQSWLNWDAANYLFIAKHGYYAFWLTRYFPLLPWLEHLVAPLTGGNPGAAGIVISNLSALGAIGLLRGLVEREWGRAVARRTILYLALFPTAFFFNVAYAESLYVLLCVGAFLALRRGNWIAAGLLAGLGALARPVGILLLIPIAVEALSRMRASGQLPRLRELAAMVTGVALPVAALAGFALYLARLYGSLTIILQSSGSDGAPGSGKNLALPGIGFARAGHALLTEGLAPNFIQVHILLDSAFTLGLIALVVATTRRLPLPYVCYAWAVLILLICTPGHNWYALYSNMRFILEIFPVFIVLGIWGERRNVERVLLIVFLPLLALLTLTFMLGFWVA
jgi:hypothetical protein